MLSHSVLATVMKNWLPFVLGPALAIESWPKKNLFWNKILKLICICTRTSFGMLDLEVLIFEFLAIDALTTSAVEIGEVSAL